MASLQWVKRERFPFLQKVGIQLETMTRHFEDAFLYYRGELESRDPLEVSTDKWKIGDILKR